MSAERPTVPALRHVRNFLALGLGNYGAMAVSMAINAMLTRRLGVGSFGRLALLLTTSQVVALLAGNWTQSAVVRFGAIEFAERGSVAETVWTRLWIALPWALAPLLAAAMFGAPLAAYLGIPVWGLLVVWGHFAAAFALATVGSAFQARQEMSRYGTVLFCDKAIMAALLLALPAATVGDPLRVVAAYAASSAVVAVGGLLLLGKRSLTPMAVSRDAYRRMWVFSSPLILSTWAAMFGTSWFDYLVLRAYRSDVELGWYSLGMLLAGVLQQVAIISSTLLLPQLSVVIAGGDFSRVRTLMTRVLPYWLLGTSLLFSVAILGGTTLVPLVFGSAFTPAVDVLAVLMLASSAFAMFSVFSALVSALGATWTLTLICFVSGGVNVAADLLLIPRYGIVGAAAATVLAYAASTVGVLAFVQRRLNLNAFPLAWLCAPVLLTCALFFAVDGVAFPLTATLAVVAVTGWLIRHFRLFGSQDTMLIRRFRFSELWSTR